MLNRGPSRRGVPEPERGPAH